MMNATPQPTTAAAVAAPRRQSPWRRMVSDFLASKTAVLELAVVVILMLTALAAPWIMPQNPYDLIQLDVLDSRLSPGSSNSLRTLTYQPGTDSQGHDLYSGIPYNLYINLGAGIDSATVAAMIDMPLGLIAAHAGNRVDSIIIHTVSLLLSFPSVLVVMTILAYFGKSITNVVSALVLLERAYYTHTVCGQALVERWRERAEAACSLALPGWRIALRHILPNCLPPLTVMGVLQVARTIIPETTLSFLGLDVSITKPPLGPLISNGCQYVFSSQYRASFYPGIALLLTLMTISPVDGRPREVLNLRIQQ